MSQIIIKNYTNEDLELDDLGDIVVPANGAHSITGNEQTLIEVASSEDLLTALIQGVDKYQISDGNTDLTLSQGIDYVRRIQRYTEVDELNRLVVRSDSRRKDWDTVFQGAGDDFVTGEIGGGTPLKFDFGADVGDNRWRTTEDDPSIPEGFARQRIDFSFNDWVYVKEGTLYFYDVPKDSYVDMSIVSPAGGFFTRKKLNGLTMEKYTYQSDIEVPFISWVVKYPIEGTAPMGDELNTESAAENPAYPGMIFRAEFTVPNTVENWQKAHGHFTLELYRIGQDIRFIPEQFR